jgi:hypothetical protein
MGAVMAEGKKRSNGHFGARLVNREREATDGRLEEEGKSSEFFKSAIQMEKKIPVMKRRESTEEDRMFQ